MIVFCFVAKTSGNFAVGAAVFGVLMLFIFRCKKPLYYAVVIAAAAAIWAVSCFAWACCSDREGKDMLEFIVPALQNLLTIENLIWINLGVFIGSVFAAIPGLTVILCIILFLPFTYQMTAIPGMMFLLGLLRGRLRRQRQRHPHQHAGHAARRRRPCWTAIRSTSRGAPRRR